MNEGIAIQEAHGKRTELHSRPIGAPIKRCHLLVRQRDDLKIPRLPGEGLQNPAIKIGFDGERFCVTVFDTEFEEVA